MKIILKSDEHGYLYVWQLATHSANKTFTKPGGLAFLQSDRHVKIAFIMGGQTTTDINFFIKIKVKKLCRENSNCQCF